MGQKALHHGIDPFGKETISGAAYFRQRPPTMGGYSGGLVVTRSAR